MNLFTKLKNDITYKFISIGKWSSLDPDDD